MLLMQTLERTALSHYTSLRAGGSAERIIIIEDSDSLADVVSHVEGPVWVLGYGTNCLISDKGLPGTVILNHSGSIHQISPTTFQVDSGVLWDEFVQGAIKQELYGIEFGSGIPGGIGAAIKGNIAAYGHKVADTLVEATVLDPKTGEIKEWRKSELGLEYRSSKLQQPELDHLVILSGTFALSEAPTGELEYESALRVANDIGVRPDSLVDRRAIILETRKRMGSLLTDNQSGPWTAGSFFKNPVVDEDQVQAIIKHDESGVTREQLLRQNQIHGGSTVRVSAAHVLLAAGFSRGQTWGNVRLNPDHILKVENIGDASAQEIYDVVQTILRTVTERLGIKLQPEVRFLGEF
jgi:UDP-N-acetylmuramate dehydrogenase